jgi:hypothetical protein
MRSSIAAFSSTIVVMQLSSPELPVGVAAFAPSVPAARSASRALQVLSDGSELIMRPARSIVRRLQSIFAQLLSPIPVAESIVAEFSSAVAV